MFWRKGVLAALLCALLLAGCGSSTTPEPGGQMITVTTERGGVVDERSLPARDPGEENTETYILNRGSVKFRRPDCAWAAKISGENRIEWTGDRETLIEVGYRPCSVCKP